LQKVYDVRAVRIIVDDIKDCYTALGIVHHLWQPIHGEFDDYISHPKGNFYRSLHTAVEDENGRSLEVQIRTREMHEHAELGVAAHWRYKEAGSAAKAGGAYEDKISWLRQLLSWRDEIADSTEWVQQFKRAALDDTIYVLTPQDKVIDLPRGATPLDFAYRLHTDLGHRCRGAKVDGHMTVSLSTPLQNGQRVEIVSIKSGGPSRDWLNPAQGYLATSRARAKVKQWFAAQDEAEQLAQGRSLVTRELQREGRTQASLDELAAKLGLKSAEALFLGAARGEVGMRAIDAALRGGAEPLAPEPEIHHAQEPRRGQPHPGGGRGQPADADGQVLQTDAARCHHRLRHARQGHLDPSRRVRELPQHGGAQSRARDRRRMGRAGRGDLSGRPGGGCRRPPGLAARHLRRPVAREDQRHRGEDAIARRRPPA
jgi:GTP pyrophosphokinase